ncbi:nucleoside hydrolase [Priestia flexa]|uniref:Nucleoside hydrolase n=1 Tax=Priestia flexa TaxID=86664 RepID=A0ABU4J6S8_9BACI|nr:nucleoside hydrolase [Priestia flexa]MDW8516708.1 nucleoside hydrolase [Priestia flexa]WHX80605.1 nucleoside hydrolase [Priestia flexa]
MGGGALREEINVLLFMDPGIDDALALMYALLHPNINVVGIVSGYGNVSKEDATLNTSYVLTLANRKDIPIIEGAKGPITGEISVFYPEIHGETLGPINVPPSFALPVEPFSKSFELIETYKGNITVIATGRLTELAMLFVLHGDVLNEYVNEFFIMGGAFMVPGNVTPVAEANFHGDSIAANVVMERAEKVRVYPLNVTHKVIVKPETIQKISSTSQNPFQPLILPIYTYYFEAYKKQWPGIQGTPIHDIVPLMALVNDELIQYVQRKVSVELSGEAKGESIADFRPKTLVEEQKEPSYIAWGINEQAFLKELTTILIRPVK